MNGYVTGVIAVSIAAGIINMLAPGDENGVRRYVKYIVSLAVTIALLSPIISVLKTLPELLDSAVGGGEGVVTTSPEIYGEMTAQTAETVENALEEYISAHYGVSAEVKIELDCGDYDCIIITGAELRMKRSDSIYFDAVTAYVGETLGCDVRLIETE